MTSYEERGAAIRTEAKTLVLELMKANPECGSRGGGMRQAELFRQCGLDWGNYPKATSTNQQFWIVALLRELEREGKVRQLGPGGPWCITTG